MKRVFQFYAAFLALCLLAAPASADPFLQVTANHLGGGHIQYTLTAVNDLGRNIAVQITASGDINQVPHALFPDNPPDGGFDLLSQAGPPIFGDALFNLALDSWWDDTDLVIANPPFADIIPDGAVGGFVGSTQFSFSALSFTSGDIISTRIGQIVVNDQAAAGLPLGPIQVINSGGLARLDIIDIDNVGPNNLAAPSLIAAQGDNFSITGSFFVIPEPSGGLLVSIAILMLTVTARRRLPNAAR